MCFPPTTLLAITVAASIVPSPQLICAVKVPVPPDITPAVIAFVVESKIAEDACTLKVNGGGTLIEPEAREGDPVPELLVAVTVNV